MSHEGQISNYKCHDGYGHPMAGSRGETRGVHFIELTRNLPWNIDSELWSVITISQYIMSKELNRVLTDNYPISIKMISGCLPLTYITNRYSAYRLITLQSYLFLHRRQTRSMNWYVLFLWYFCQYHLSMLVDDIAHTFQCHIDLSMVSLRRGLT